MIRPAVAADIPVLIERGREFHNRTHWREIAEFDAASFEATLQVLISGHLNGALLTDGRSMAAFVCAPLFVNRHITYATELFWYGGGVPMLDAMEDAARERGAAVLVMLSIDGLRSDAVARLYRMRGYRRSESSFVKRL